MVPGVGAHRSLWRGVLVAALAAWALVLAAPAAGSDDPLTFQPFAAYAVGSDPESVAIADVTGDGRNDVLVSTSTYFDPENDGKLFVFAQTPDGNLANTARRRLQLEQTIASGVEGAGRSSKSGASLAGSARARLIVTYG